MLITMKQPTSAFDPPPSPLKRVLPDDCLADRDDEWPRKRRKGQLITHQPRYHQSGSELITQSPQDQSVADAYLTRSISTALAAAGFDGATKSALESFRSSVEEYIVSFLSTVSGSMHSCRRTAPIPQDFIFALSDVSLTSSDLRSHLKPIIPPSISHIPVLPTSTPTNNLDFPFPADFDHVTKLLVPDESPNETQEGERRRHIPGTLPAFPSNHAWKSTPLFIHREFDPLKLREQSIKEGLSAEKALRRLMLARQQGLGLATPFDNDASQSTQPAPTTHPRSSKKPPKKVRFAPKHPKLIEWEKAMKEMMEYDKQELEKAEKAEKDEAEEVEEKGDEQNKPDDHLANRPEAEPTMTTLEEDILMDFGELGSPKDPTTTIGLFEDELDEDGNLRMDGIVPDVEVAKPVKRRRKWIVDRPMLDLSMIVNSNQKYWRDGSGGMG